MARPEPPSIRVAIVGGGFGGLAAAIGLQKYAHVAVNLYEASPSFSELGAGVQVGHNAVRAMQAIDPRIAAAYQSVCQSKGTPRYRSSSDGKKRTSYLQFATWQGHGKGAMREPYHEAEFEEPPSQVHRSHLLRELAALGRPDMWHFGKKLVGVEEKGNGPVVLRFEDGEEAEADVLIGADGVHSVVRPLILREKHPLARACFSGHVVFRAVIEASDVQAAVGDAIRDLDGLQVIGGPDHNIVGYKLDGGKYNVAIVDMSGELAAAEWVHGSSWNAPADVGALRRKFESWHPVARRLIDLLPEDGRCRAFALWVMPPAPMYYRGRIAMLGDAAHAMLPYQSAGAGQAFEDAMVLERVLGHARKPSEVCAALQAYDAVRRFRAQKVAFTSRQTGEMSAGRHPEAKGDPKKIAQLLEGRVEWIWAADIDGQVRDALDLMENVVCGKNYWMSDKPIARQNGEGKLVGGQDGDVKEPLPEKRNGSVEPLGGVNGIKGSVGSRVAVA